MSPRRAPLLLAALVLVVGALRAQDEAAPPVGESVSYSWQLGEYQIDERRFVAVGAVQLSWRGATLRCNQAVLWPVGAPDDSGAGIRENEEGKIGVRALYAEGTVVLTLPDEEMVFRADRLYLDLVSRRGMHLDAVVRKDIIGRDGRAIKLSFRAEELRQLDPTRFEFLDVHATTSPSLSPGYRIETPAIRVQVDPRRVIPERGPEPYRNIRYELDESVLYLGDLPIFATPPFSGNTADRFGYSFFRGASVDASSKFGPSARVTLGAPIDIDGEPWGDVEVPLQYLGDRGFGGGLDLRYAGEDYRGTFEGFYQNDRGFDQLFGDPTTNDRGRATWRHRHFLPEHIQLDVEFSKISDRGFLPEYHESEFKSGKEQETLVYLKRARETTALTFLAKTRLNEFQDQNEALPQLGYNVFSYPVLELGEGTFLYFDADYEIGRLTRRYDEALGIRDERAARIDLDNTFGVPLHLGPVVVEPFAGVRYTWYERGRVAESGLSRIGYTWGGRASIELSRVFDTSGGLFDLDGLRHVILFDVEYRSVQHVSREVADFIPFDAVDGFTERDEIRIGLRNRLQTFWEIDGESEAVDFVDLDVEWTYFPHADRDNGGEEIGNLDVDLAVRFTPNFVFLTDFEYNFALDDFEILNSTVGWAPSRDVFLAVGYRRYAGVNDAVVARGQWRVNERLGLAVEGGYDFVENRSQDQSLRIQRIGEDWVFEFEIEHDNQGGFGFGISFTPRIFFDPRVRFGAIRNEPRFSTLRDDVLR
ncbi:MAG: LPS assembly protein LptD [Planctomycetota bacterium]